MLFLSWQATERIMEARYEELLVQGVEALGLPISPGLDVTVAGEYTVYDYRSSGALFGDDAPCLDQRQWTLVYVAPPATDRTETRTAIRRIIFQIFGEWPSEDPSSDANGQRYIYSFESIGGLSYGAD